VAVPGGMLVTGGWSHFETGDRQASDRAELILLDGNPQVNPFRLGHARAEHTAVLIDDSGRSPKVLVCGGLAEDGVTVESSCELVYIDRDPPEAEDLGVICQRWLHTATQLTIDGEPAVLLAGGFASTGGVFEADKSALLIKDILGTGGSNLLPMVSRRAGHTATLLNNGMIVFIGGVSSLTPPVDVTMPEVHYEIFNPG